MNFSIIHDSVRIYVLYRYTVMDARRNNIKNAVVNAIFVFWWNIPIYFFSEIESSVKILKSSLSMCMNVLN